MNKDLKEGPTHCEDSSRDLPSNTDAADQHYTFVLMEWAKGCLFWGIIKFDPSLSDINIVVQNCTKPCGKIIDKTVDLEKIFKNTNQSKLSNSDYQLNPDMSFCILEVKKGEFMLLEKSTGSSKNELIVLKADYHDEFISKLKESFSAYISDSE